MTSRLAIFGRREGNPPLDFVPDTANDVASCFPRDVTTSPTNTDPKREEMMVSVTELMNGFIYQVLGAIIHTLRFLQVPRASAEANQTNLGPPPVGYVEGLCHIIAVASTQLKLCPERHQGREAEGLRKKFLTLTNAMCNLFELSETTGRRISKKIQPTLKQMEIESEMALVNLYDQQLPKINYRFPSPSPNCIESTWRDATVEDAGNGVSLKIHWGPFNQQILCTLDGSEFSFNEINIENQLKIFHGFLVQGLQSVLDATSMLNGSKDSWKQAKRDLSAFWSYLLQLESEGRIRPEEKDALLLVLRAHLRTSHHLLDQLKRTLKRARVSLSQAIWNIRTKLKELENLTQTTEPNNSKGNPFGYSGISVGISQPLRLTLPESNKEVEEVTPELNNELKVTSEFFNRLSETTEEVTGESTSSLLAAHELLCGHAFGQDNQRQSKVIGSLLLLGQTLVSIGNFRDCSEIQRSLLTNGLRELLAKLDELGIGSSIHEKLRQELEGIEREADLVSMEIRVLMNGLFIPSRENEVRIRTFENQSTTSSSETTENLWTLKLCHQFPESAGDESTGMQLLLFFQNTEVKYNELTRMKQGRVVVEVIRFLLSLFGEVSSSLQSAIQDLRKGTENLKSLKSDLRMFINEGYGPDMEMNSELYAIMNLLHRAKETAGETFRQINSEIKKASRFLLYIESYAKTRISIEVPLPSVMTRPGHHRGRLRLRSPPVPGQVIFRNEEAQQIQRKNKKKVNQIEAILQAALQEVKVIQIPLKLKTDRHFSDPLSSGPLVVN